MTASSRYQLPPGKDHLWWVVQHAPLAGHELPAKSGYDAKQAAALHFRCDPDEVRVVELIPGHRPLREAAEAAAAQELVVIPGLRGIPKDKHSEIVKAMCVGSSWQRHVIGVRFSIDYLVADELIRQLAVAGAARLSRLVYHCSDAPVAELRGKNARIKSDWTCPECESEVDDCAFDVRYDTRCVVTRQWKFGREAKR